VKGIQKERRNLLLKRNRGNEVDREEVLKAVLEFKARAGKAV